MAILGKFDQSYTKTGNGGLNGFSGIVASIPGIRKIPIFGTTIVGAAGYLDTGIDTVKWLLRGKVASAVTVAAAGTVATSANIASGVGLNWGSQILTGRSIGTHARKLTESAIGGVTGALGVKPQVLRSYPVGIGSIGGAAPATPGRFATQIANERGQDPNAMYGNYMRGEGGVHVNELGSAYAGRA